MPLQVLERKFLQFMLIAEGGKASATQFQLSGAREGYGHSVRTCLNYCHTKRLRSAQWLNLSPKCLKWFFFNSDSKQKMTQTTALI